MVCLSVTRRILATQLYYQCDAQGIWVITPVQPVCDRQFGTPRLHNQCVTQGIWVTIPVQVTQGIWVTTPAHQRVTQGFGSSYLYSQCVTRGISVTTRVQQASYTGRWLPHLQNQLVTQGVGYYTCRTSELHRALVTTPAEPASYTGRWLSHLQNQRVTQGVGYLQNQRVTRGDLHVFLSLRSSRVLFPAPSSSAFLCKSHERPATVACPRKVPVDSLETPGACWRHLETPGACCKHPVHAGDTRYMLEIRGACWRHPVHVGCWRHSVHVGNIRCVLETPGVCWRHPVHVGDIRCMLETPGACWRHPCMLETPGACFVFGTKNNNLPLTPPQPPSSPSRLLQ